MPSNAATFSIVFVWANDIVREEQNLYEIEVTLQKPRTVPDWRGSVCDLPTSPSVTILTINVDVTEHLGPAHTAEHTASNCPKSFKKWTPKTRYLNRNSTNKFVATLLAPSFARQNALEGKHNLYLRHSFYVSITEVTPISAIGFIIGKYLLERKIRSEHNTALTSRS